MNVALHVSLGMHSTPSLSRDPHLVNTGSGPVSQGLPTGGDLHEAGGGQKSTGGQTSWNLKD